LIYIYILSWLNARRLHAERSLLIQKGVWFYFYFKNKSSRSYWPRYKLASFLRAALRICQKRGFIRNLMVIISRLIWCVENPHLKLTFYVCHKHTVFSSPPNRGTQLQLHSDCDFKLKWHWKFITPEYCIDTLHRYIHSNFNIKS